MVVKNKCCNPHVEKKSFYGTYVFGCEQRPKDFNCKRQAMVLFVTSWLTRSTRELTMKEQYFSLRINNKCGANILWLILKTFLRNTMRDKFKVLIHLH